MSQEMKQSFPNSTCPYCGMNMKSGDGSWWCMDKTCHEQFYPYGIAQTSDWKEGPAQTGEVKPVQQWEAESLAKLFHETYERLAPNFGYETRKASAKPWSEVPDQNKALMIAVCAEIIATHSSQVAPSSSACEYESAGKFFNRAHKAPCVLPFVPTMRILEFANRYATERRVK